MARHESSIELRAVSKSDYRFLYNLLKERDPRANISHKKMPTYNEHVMFVSSRPYSKWYVILYGNVSPKNKKSIRFFKNNGFKLIQYTFELNKI